jgi:N-acetylglucosaminyl-diphospho-decaprenol L-rhamnosyltransferase
MKLSIVIVTYESRHEIGTCLDSIAQHKPDLPFEVFVVDNASTDGTADFVERNYSWVTLLRNQTNQGFSRGNNRAIAQAQGKFVLLLNPDTRVTQGALDSLVTLAEATPRLGTLGARLVYPSGAPQPSSYPLPGIWAELRKFLFLEKISERRARRARLTSVGSSWGAALLFPRLVKGIPVLMDGSIFLYSEDIELCWRLKRMGLRNFVTASATIEHHHNKSGEKKFGSRASSERLTLMRDTLKVVTAKYWRGPFKTYRFSLFCWLVAANARLRAQLLSTVYKGRYSATDLPQHLAEHRATANVFWPTPSNARPVQPLGALEKIALSIGALVFLILTIIIAVELPRGRGNDEDSHVTVVRYVAQKHSLPEPLAIDFGVNREPHQPPLYYITGAVWLNALRPLGFGVDALRIFSVVLGVAMYWTVVAISIKTFSVGWRVIAPLLVAALPMLGQIFGASNNDSLAILLTTVSILLLVQTWRQPRARIWFVLTPLVGALAVLSKLFAGPTILLVGLASFLQACRSYRVRWWLLGSILGLAPIIAWLAFNVSQTGWLIPEFHFSSLDLLEPYRYVPDRTTPGAFTVVLLQSLIGRLGSWDIQFSATFYQLYLIVVLAALAGLLAKTKVVIAPLVKRLAWWGVAAFVLQMLVLIELNRTFFQPQARYVYPALIGLVALIAIGLERFADKTRWAWQLCALALLALGVWSALQTALLLG